MGPYFKHRHHKYILDGKTPVPEPDLTKWGMWMETADRHVARDLVGDVIVSTVFLGLDHNYLLDGPPILFETMVFGGSLGGKMDRYETWEAAELGHAAMLKKVMDTCTWPDDLGEWVITDTEKP